MTEGQRKERRKTCNDQGKAFRGPVSFGGDKSVEGNIRRRKNSNQDGTELKFKLR